MPRRSNYDKYPYIAVTSAATDCRVGWDAIAAELKQRTGARTVICLECYPGAFVDEIEQALTARLRPDRVLRAADFYKSDGEINRMLARHLTDDRVFGRLNDIALEDFFDSSLLAKARETVASTDGMLLVVGTGAALIAPDADLLVYADMARWEIQMRQRKGTISNLGVKNCNDSPSEKYKRAFFVDWRAADRLKRRLLNRIDLLLDTNDVSLPKMVSGEHFRAGLRMAVARPFRVVPFFDPGPWGGQWMREICGLPDGPPNYAWCFDCVPEENSLLLGFGEVRVEIPSIDLVFAHPRDLLGEAVHARFGAEFPIRFDFLDTMDGGNLSFQVHPLTEYIQEKFGVPYTQDESYYLLDTKEDGCVYLGLREGIDREQMARDLRDAQDGKIMFPAEKYANCWPARKHDHFLIPAGTVHCSGKNSMVLEISATPYIFTFKLWDWGRLGLDGRPRPIHLEHGLANIQWDRTTPWVKANLVNRIEPISGGESWREERTGLHEREFIETRRHWFTGKVPHSTKGGVQVFNLVEGDEAVVESPTGAFDPFVVHYAETFIVPASVGEFTVRPSGTSEGSECGTIKAFVRTRA
ncbi:MAG TPA: class I mannose-6-phosphate isomerase [Terriglobales bacterium]|nr:class I mannose-6-phosphate isomerase [Terriglobales bacterium]